MSKETKNLPASIRSRLMKVAKAFALEREPDWTRFVQRSLLEGEVPENFSQIFQRLRTFLLPPIRAALEGATFDFNWKHGGPWEEMSRY